MAKRTLIGSTKLKRLCRILGCPSYVAVGILESLWHMTAKEAIRGDIGRFSDSDIALGIDYDGDAAALVSALTDGRFLDRSQKHRLIVHDWPDHCEDAVHMALAREVELFADGSIPRLTKFREAERERILEAYAQKFGDLSVERADSNEPSGNEQDGAQNEDDAQKCAEMRTDAPESALPLPKPLLREIDINARERARDGLGEESQPERPPDEYPNRPRPYDPAFRSECVTWALAGCVCDEATVDEWLDNRTAIGWRIEKTGPILDWQASLRSWVRKSKQDQFSPGRKPRQKPHEDNLDEIREKARKRLEANLQAQVIPALTVAEGGAAVVS